MVSVLLGIGSEGGAPRREGTLVSVKLTLLLAFFFIIILFSFKQALILISNPVPTVHLIFLVCFNFCSVVEIEFYLKKVSLTQ